MVKKIVPAALFTLTLVLSTRMIAAEPSVPSVPGVVIDYSPASSRSYIGSPSIAMLTDGSYVASHDFFGPGSGNNRTAVFVSMDRGKTWKKQTELTGQWWSTLFVHKEQLYIIGTTTEYGSCVIRKSADDGKTWTEPKDASSGILISDHKCHCAPVPVIVHNGRIWRAMEDATGPGKWGEIFKAFVMSAPVDADLLDAKSWTRTNALPRDTSWIDGKFVGWLEGNAVGTPDGHVVDILRVESGKQAGLAAMVHIGDEGKTASFDPKTGFISFPGANKKFTIRFDPVSKLYWSLSNAVPDVHRDVKPAIARNTLVAISSPDLKTWEIRGVVLYHPDPKKHAFQYVDWQFDGDDLIVASRTAYDDNAGGAKSQHDANYLTFHRIEKFREMKFSETSRGLTFMPGHY